MALFNNFFQADFEIPSHYKGSHDSQRKLLTAETALPEVRVACLVMTMKGSHASKAAAVKATWGRRCNVLVFMSDDEDKTLPAIKVDVKSGRQYLWNKTKSILNYASEHLMDKADWFLKADDDTYVIMENLHHFLRTQDFREEIFAGCRFKPFSRDGFMSGGAGYVLSSAALLRFASMSQSFCDTGPTGDEDVKLGMCLSNLNVTFVDTRDKAKRMTFFPMQPYVHLKPGKIPQNSWFYKYTYYPAANNASCCSKRAITFHWITPEQMFELEYFIYELRIS